VATAALKAMTLGASQHSDAGGNWHLWNGSVEHWEA